jgi:hypothetical protein
MAEQSVDVLSEEYWPPAESAAEEIAFVYSLRRCATEGEIEQKVAREKSYRLRKIEHPSSICNSLPFELSLRGTFHGVPPRIGDKEKASLSPTDSPSSHMHAIQPLDHGSDLANVEGLRDQS